MTNRVALAHASRASAQHWRDYFTVTSLDLISYETCQPYYPHKTHTVGSEACLGAHDLYLFRCIYALRCHLMKATRLVVTAVFPNVEPSTQALRGARNISSSPAGRELINTVVQVGAFKENNHNKRYIKHQEYRFRCFRPRPPLLLLLSLPHCECPVAE